MKIKLSDEDINILPNYKNIDDLEKTVGSIFGLISKVESKQIRFVDIVNVYYWLQDDTAYSRDIISKRVLADGFAVHLEQLINLLGDILSGGDTKKVEAEKKP